MSNYRALLGLRAFQSGQAQPYRERRHVHVSDKPFVTAYVQMAGEPFTLWGALVGRFYDTPTWICAPDPRNRDGQSDAFSRLAEVLNNNVRECWRTEDEPLQIWVSNSTGAANLQRIGRVMRSRKVSDAVSLAGSFLDVYAQTASAPGSALCIAATEALRAHKVTGQSSFEDSNLAAQLVWWDRTVLAQLGLGLTPEDAKGMTVFAAAARAEKVAMGTLTNPRADENSLQPLVERFNAARRAEASSKQVEEQLSSALRDQVFPIWNAIWAAHRELAQIPAARTADVRWPMMRGSSVCSSIGSKAATTIGATSTLRCALLVSFLPGKPTTRACCATWSLMTGSP